MTTSQSSNGGQSLSKVAAGGGPRAPEIMFELAPSVTAQPAVVAKVTRTASSASVTGLGSISARAYYPWWESDVDPTVWGPLDRYTYSATSSAVGGTYAVKSYIGITVTVQTTGWYLINVVATQIKSEMRRYTSGSGYAVIQNFAQPATTGYSSFPVVLNLAAGFHQFSWVNLGYYPSVYVSEVSITKL